MTRIGKSPIDDNLTLEIVELCRRSGIPLDAISDSLEAVGLRMPASVSVDGPPEAHQRAEGRINIRYHNDELRAWMKAAGPMSIENWIRLTLDEAAG